MQFVKTLMIFWHCVIHFLSFSYVVIGFRSYSVMQRMERMLLVLITMVINVTEIRTDLVGPKKTPLRFKICVGSRLT